MTSLQDIEAQRTATKITPEDDEKSRAEYVHSGRGGAGNYTNSSILAAATAENVGVNQSLSESKPPETGYYGRGGAGNYRSGEAEKEQEEKTKSKVREKAHQQVVNDIEMGLMEPEKAHLGIEKVDS